MYDRAVAWTDKHKPDDPELRKFPRGSRHFARSAL